MLSLSVPSLSVPSRSALSRSLFSRSTGGDPVGRHGFALGALLLLLLPLVGTSAPWSADVGAHLFQAVAMAEGEGEVSAHPMPEADPEGILFPIHLSLWAENDPTAGEPGAETGYVVYGKHTAYSWVVGGLHHLGGLTALLALSVLSTLAAAVGVARLAALVDDRAAVTALWLSGLGSPLFFDAYIGYAHTLAAAGIAWATLWSLEWARSTDHGPGRLLAAGALVVMVAQARTEAPLAGIALGLGLMTLGIGRAGATGGASPPVSRRARAVWGGAFLATMAWAGRFIDLALAIPSASHVRPDPRNAQWGFLDGRWSAFSITFWRPGHHPADLLILVASTSIAVLAYVVSRRPPSDGQTQASLPLAAGTILVVVAIIVRVVGAPPPLVPGLLMAAPLLVAGLVLVRREVLADATLRFLAVSFALFCGAVLATEYPYGGVAEWGGRYFAVGLPLGLAPAAVGIHRWARVQLPSVKRLAMVVALAALVLNGAGLVGLRQARTDSADLAMVSAEAVAMTRTTDGADPVVVSLIPSVARRLWDQLDDARWLLAIPDDLPTLGYRLVDNEVAGITLISYDPETHIELLSDWYVPRSGAHPKVGSATVIVMDRTAARPSP